MIFFYFNQLKEQIKQFMEEKMKESGCWTLKLLNELVTYEGEKQMFTCRDHAALALAFLQHLPLTLLACVNNI